jgi:hypothetical protein
MLMSQILVDGDGDGDVDSDVRDFGEDMMCQG